MSYQITNQSPAQNIQKEIDMMSFIFYWKMRQGKTLNAIRLALDDRYNGRIYSNVDIFKDGESLLIKRDKDGNVTGSNKITTFDQLDKIRFSYTHWIILLDEAGINANSKDSHTLESRLLQKVLFLAGKKNCSVVWIAQRYESIDINARVLADIIIEVRKIRRWKKHPLFQLTKQKQKFSRLEYVQRYQIDTITMNNIDGITYDTLEESVMDKKERKKKTKKDLE